MRFRYPNINTNRHLFFLIIYFLNMTKDEINTKKRAHMEIDTIYLLLLGSEIYPKIKIYFSVTGSPKNEKKNQLNTLH